MPELLTVDVKLRGTTPVDRLLLMTSNTDCPILGKTSLKKRGETASQAEPDGLIWPTRSSKNDREPDSNLSKATEQGTVSEGSNAGAEMRAIAVATLSIKKCRKLSHILSDASKLKGCGALRTVSMVLNNTHGL